MHFKRTLNPVLPLHNKVQAITKERRADSSKPADNAHAPQTEKQKRKPIIMCI